MTKERKGFELPKEFAEKWIAALRSGEYKQGLFKLYRDSSKTFCCLGVACAVEGININNIIGELFIRKGISEKIPKILCGDTLYGLPATLSDMNDTGKSFEEIADWIEQNVKFI